MLEGGGGSQDSFTKRLQLRAPDLIQGIETRINPGTGRIPPEYVSTVRYFSIAYERYDPTDYTLQNS